MVSAQAPRCRRVRVEFLRSLNSPSWALSSAASPHPHLLSGNTPSHLHGWVNVDRACRESLHQGGSEGAHLWWWWGGQGQGEGKRVCFGGRLGWTPEALEIPSRERLCSLPTDPQSCWPWPCAYLEGRGAWLQARQRAAVHHACHAGVAHPHKVADQVSDLHQPVRAQHGDHLVGALGRCRVELGEHLQSGVLVLQGAAAAGALPTLLFLLVLVLALPGRPGGGRGTGGVTPSPLRCGWEPCKGASPLPAPFLLSLTSLEPGVPSLSSPRKAPP